MGLFKKATKQEAKLRLAIAGPSGSGKTYTALAIATGLGGPIAVVDTEHGSASKYADIFDFDVAEMHAPYHPDKYIRTIQEAASAGYKVVILDSLSHAWNGEGGILSLVEEAAARIKGNSYAGWKDVTPIQNRFIEAIVAAEIHIIGTMRSKQEYVQEKNERGYTTIRKVGMAPVQRDGFEYEFDVVFDMDIDNRAIVTKTRCSALTGKVIEKPGAQVAMILKDWLKSDSPVREDKQQPKRQVDTTTGEIMEPEVDFGMGNGKAEENTPYYRHAWNQLTGKPYDLVKWIATLHKNSDKTCTVKQYGFLVSLIDALTNDQHGYILSVLCQAEIDKNNRPGLKVVDALFELLPKTIKDESGEKIDNPAYRADIAELITGIAAQQQAQVVPAGVNDEEDIPY